MTTEFDHISIATHDAHRQAPYLRNDLHGHPLGTHVTDHFIATTWQFARGISMEFLEPNDGGEENFVRRFLARHGEMFHHLTFKVADLSSFLDRARAQSVPLAMLDRSNPKWQEVFILPTHGPATLIQVVETGEPRREAGAEKGCSITGVHLVPLDYDITLALLTNHLDGILTQTDAGSTIDWPNGSTIYLHRPTPSGQTGITGLDVECQAPSSPSPTDASPWVERVNLTAASVSR